MEPFYLIFLEAFCCSTSELGDILQMGLQCGIECDALNLVETEETLA